MTYLLCRGGGSRRRPVIAVVLNQALALRRQTPLGFLRSVSVNDAAFVVAWEVQSQLATIVMFSLIAFVSIWASLATMLAWSVIACIIYHHARERGLPDLVTVEAPKRGYGPSAFVRHAAGSAVRVWFVGLHNMVFARVACSVLRGGDGFEARARRAGILGLGMTLFGVTTAEHLLRRAGFKGSALLYRGLLGPFVNVPYRIFLSAAVMHAAMSGVDIVCSLGGTCLP
jgi:hypothetical protein